MTKLIIVRHAEAAGNFERIFHGQTNSDITENGKAQLEKLKERFQDIDFDVLISSDLLRAVKTAKAVNFHKGLQITQDKKLREIDGGFWENMPFEELPIKFPTEFYQWNSEPHLLQMPNGESLVAFANRIIEAVKAIVKEHKGKNICIVTHGTAIRVLMCFAQGLSLEQINEVSWCDNTAISVIDYDENLEAFVALEGDCSHLSKELSTLGKQDWWIALQKGENNK